MKFTGLGEGENRGGRQCRTSRFLRIEAESDDLLFIVPGARNGVNTGSDSDFEGFGESDDIHQTWYYFVLSFSWKVLLPGYGSSEVLDSRAIPMSLFCSCSN